MLFCRDCNEEKIVKWQGWPKKNIIPIPRILKNRVCQTCGKKPENPIHFENITWVNIGDGLPKYWVLEEFHKNQSNSQWGLPYFAIEPCSSCGEDSILSEYRAPAKTIFFFNCINCGLVSKRD